MSSLIINKGTINYIIVPLFLIFCSNGAFSQSDLAKQYHNPLGSNWSVTLAFELIF